MQNNNIKTILTSGALAFALAGCGASPNAALPSGSGAGGAVANVSANVLQFVAGTANLYGLGTGLNVVTTYRQPAGATLPGGSGTLVNSPTLSLPAAIPGGLSAGAAGAGYDASSSILTAPAPGETTKMTSTSQVPGTSCALTTFGQSGGVFGLGIEPFNAGAQADCTPVGITNTGQPIQVAPYPVPLYDTASPSFAGGADPNLFVPWGGPPAFSFAGLTTSPVGNGNYPAGTAGLSEGIDVFAGIAPVAGGTYSLSVSVPANTGTTTQSASSTLPAALTVLGAAVSPVYTSDAAGDGGGTFAVAMPAGATEAYVQITDYGPTTAKAASCNGSGTGNTIKTVGNGIGSAVYYTIVVTAGGAATLPAALGPGGTPSLCTAAQNTAANGGTATGADQVVIQLIGLDYDLYHASYPLSNGNPAPAISRPGGADDITISPATCQVGGLLGAGSCTATLPELRARGTGRT
ncbi:MAG TPA: hypothetical protein VGP41_13175 [Candidatus Lustribacter sp.]|jgi:hypothetical protein|nr:hypothetical protein [Candidatus Lustribacter sp.]